jgi:hypothetical protein
MHASLSAQLSGMCTVIEARVNLPSDQDRDQSRYERGDDESEDIPPSHFILLLSGSPGESHPGGAHRTERDNLSSLRSSHLNPANVRIQRQWAKRPGSLSRIPDHHAVKRL